MGIKREDTIFHQHWFFGSSRHTTLDQPMVVLAACFLLGGFSMCWVFLLLLGFGFCYHLSCEIDVIST